MVISIQWVMSNWRIFDHLTNGRKVCALKALGRPAIFATDCRGQLPGSSLTRFMIDRYVAMTAPLRSSSATFVLWSAASASV